MEKALADIIGIGAVLPSPEVSEIEFPFAVDADAAPAYLCEKKIGKGILPAGMLRRLGRSQRMAMLSAEDALEGVDIESTPPENRAICLGTGLGELGETAAFSENMIRLGEKEPKPAKFINSVHNSLAAQAAIRFNFKGENHTITHKGISFELALWQAAVVLREERAEVVLATGADELSPYVALVGKRLGLWRQTNEPVSPLAASGGAASGGAIPGALPGEGAASLLLKKPGSSDNRLARIKSLSIKFLKENEALELDVDTAVEFIREAVGEAELELDGLDLVLLGANGNAESDAAYEKVIEHMNDLSGNISFGVYRHACGDFFTAAAIGLYFAVRSIQENKISRGKACLAPAIKTVGGNRPGPVRNILLFHIHTGGFLSAVLVGP